MPRVAPMVPAETDVLCEGCGYTLNGLPETGNCPECGKEIDGSLGAGRGLTRWEIRPSRKAFVETTLAILFASRDFYAALATRVDTPQALLFARWHRAIAGLGFWAAAMMHLYWLSETTARMSVADLSAETFLPLAAVLCLAGPFAA